MNIEKIEKNGTICAVVRSDEVVVTDPQSALDLLMTAKYDVGTKNIVIDKRLIKEDFFILSSGFAGEILQKYVNYGGRIAIYLRNTLVPQGLSLVRQNSREHQRLHSIS